MKRGRRHELLMILGAGTRWQSHMLHVRVLIDSPGPPSAGEELLSSLLVSIITTFAGHLNQSEGRGSTMCPRRRFFRSSELGLTLVEMVMTLAIGLILVSIALPVLVGAVQNY